VKAVVLVGGEGTRLRPLTNTCPKPLLPIANQPFLERQLTWLEHHGVDEVVLSLGYLPDVFAAWFPEGSFRSLKLRYAVEPEPLGTAGAIGFAAQDLDGRIVVCNGDVLTTLDLAALVSFHRSRGARATIALTEVSDPSPFGVVPTRDDGAVAAFVEKPAPGRAPSNWINAGIYVLEPDVLARIPSGRPVSIERETFPQLLEGRGQLYAQGSAAYWIDIGTPASFVEANLDVLRERLGRPVAPGAQELARGVWRQGSPAVAGAATVVPPVLFGDGAVVEAGARVASSVLGAGVVVSAGARVLRSVLLDGAVVDEHATVVDSIVGPGATIGAGATVASSTVVAAGAETSKER
jgi:mannose-1-phosphate guanylyltransferase